MAGLKQMPVKPDWQRTYSAALTQGVDRNARVLRGMVVAQEGPFKTPGRGEFDREGLQQIVRLAADRPAGLKSRFAHPTLSDDGLGKYLGRVRDLRMGNAINADGKKVAAVRGDLHFDATSSDTPHGDLAGYVMTLAESDPQAISSSLVLQAEERLRLDTKGIPLVDNEGDPLPPLWFPTVLHASDVVDTGDAVDGILSSQLDAESLPDGAVRKGAELLDRVFAGQSDDVIRARCLSWLDRYLSLRAEKRRSIPTPRLDKLMQRVGKANLTIQKYQK